MNAAVWMSPSILQFLRSSNSLPRFSFKKKAYLYSYLFPPNILFNWYNRNIWRKWERLVGLLLSEWFSFGLISIDCACICMYTTLRYLRLSKHKTENPIHFLVISEDSQILLPGYLQIFYFCRGSHGQQSLFNRSSVC